MVDLHLAIPNNNKRELLRRSLEVLPQAATRFTVTATVVDNASTDGSAEMVADEFPEVGLVRRNSSYGSSANFNAGILAQSSARYLAIMHEDAYPRPGAFDLLIKFLDAHPKAGGLSPRIRFPNGSIDHTAGQFPTILSETVGRRRPLARWFGPRQYDETGNEPFIVDCNSATCLIFRREALERVGLFDESFPIFYEEIDLTRRLADDGWETWFVPAAEVVHEGGVTRQRSEVSAEVQARYRAIADYFAGSKYLYFRKHHGLAAEFVLRGLDLVISGLGIAAAVAPGMRRRRGSDEAERADAHRYVLRNAVTNWPRLDSARQLHLPAVPSAGAHKD
jgi:GT2 family glycosyltransferase